MKSTMLLIIRPPANNNRLDTEVFVPIKHLSNFCRSHNLPFINCEIEPDLTWSRNCIKWLEIIQ